MYEEFIDYNKIEELAYKKSTWWVIAYIDITNCIKWVSRFTEEYSTVANTALDTYNDLLRKYIE